MGCEQFRNEMMALLDGEIDDEHRSIVEQHVRMCPHCQGELHRFQELNNLTRRVRFARPSDDVWALYYHGVCRKFESRGGWLLWSMLALVLVLTGMLMLSGFVESALANALGVTSMLCGIALLWLGHFCNCRR